MCVCERVGVEVMGVVKGHQVSLPPLPKERRLRGPPSFSCWLNENLLLHHRLFVLVTKTLQPLIQLAPAHTHTHTQHEN